MRIIVDINFKLKLEVEIYSITCLNKRNYKNFYMLFMNRNFKIILP